MASADMQEPPWCLPPRELESWYQENIQKGTTLFDDTCSKAVNEVVKTIQKICSTDKVVFDVSKIVKGGSLGKGTMVKDFSDIDLVAFICPPQLKPVKEVGLHNYQQQLKTILTDLKRELEIEIGERSRSFRTTNFSVQFSIRVDREWLDVDLLPTAKNVPDDKKGKLDLFQTMLAESWWDRKFYSVSFVKSQLEFIQDQDGCVKELIRLVKYWAHKKLPGNLHHSYPLELITIFRWQRGGKQKRFSLALGLKSVLLMLTSLRGIRTYWKGRYSKAFANQVIDKLYTTRPVMLDPINPTSNVFEIYHDDDNLEVINVEAWKTLRSDLLKGVVLRRRQRWCR
ncbi:2'-5'-oligoadenylate synthase 3-like [Patiria miniata]|uniref:2'-5' oligoadenylate synthase n=1 Tax=Patiria miniata TaxID=46514 RepID=A0A914BTV6_PATMI|nr:2'-5'-oligoadenylate synthase 3-like [Patiria miniata]